MKERPILFSAPMVRALLDGSKTQTRRVMKPQPEPNGTWLKSRQDFVCLNDYYPPSAMLWNGGMMGGDAGEIEGCTHGVIGDRLWVRENTVIAPPDFGEASLNNVRDSDGRWRVVQYMATHSDKWPASDYGLKVTPSIFMPRWASRITLEITDVRVQRLQDISEADAKAEGVESPDKERYERDDSICARCGGPGVIDLDCAECDTHTKRFRNLWDSINAKRAPWSSNPWVWALTFARKVA
jgi:hypothetical protein